MSLQFWKLAPASSIVFFATNLLGLAMISVYPCNAEVPAIPVLQTNFDDMLVVPVVIKKKTYHFFVDTGSSVTVIDSAVADKITRKIQFADLSANYRAEFENVKIVSGTISNKDLIFLEPVDFSIGNEEIRDNDIWLSRDLSLSTQSLGVKIDGIIGIDTFRKFNWQVDNEKKQLELWKDAPSAASYDRCIGYQDNYNSSPVLYLTDVGNSDVSLRVDTGADESYVGKELIKSFGSNTSSRTSPDKYLGADMGGLQSSESFILKGLYFDGRPLGEFRAGDNGNDMYGLGMNFFERFRRYAFIPSRMMFCYDAASIEKEEQASIRSVPIRYVNERIEVFYSQTKEISPLGLRNKDIILKVNGSVYGPAQIGRIREILSHTPLGHLTLTIQREAVELTIQL